MELRKLQRTADGTYFVTLPKSWVSRIGADRGMVLSISEERDGSLHISPYGEFERKIRSSTLSLSPLLEREIEERYLLGYDVIQIESTEVIPSEVRESVKRTLKKFVGLEILEEDSRRIAIQCLIEPSLLVPEKILRRLHVMALAMQKDAVVSFARCDPELARTVVERDEEVDRIYFLLVRVVRAALTDPILAGKLETTPIDCLDHRILASFIENFADHSAAIAENTPKGPPQISWEGAVQHIEKAGELVNAMYKDAVEAVLSRNLKVAAGAGRLYEEVGEELKSAELALANMPPELLDKTTSTIAALKAMREINIDIADLAVTR